MTIGADDIDDIYGAILDHLQDGRDEGDPWGLTTPAECYRGLEASGRLDDIGYPVQETIQNRMQKLALAGILENKYDSGCYELVEDPRE